MPRERKERRHAEPNFEDTFNEMAKTKEGQIRLLDLARFLCEVLDAAIEHGDTWLNIGTTRDGLLANITLHEKGAVTFAPGATLGELLLSVDSL